MREAKTLLAISGIALALRLLYAVSLHVEASAPAPAEAGAVASGWSVGGVVIRWVQGEPRGPDAVTYDRLAWTLASRGEYRVSALFGKDLMAFRPVLFPLALSGIYRLFGRSTFAGELMQCVVGSAVCVLVYGLARELVSRRAALIAAMLAALSPSLLYYSTALSTEMLYTLCLVAAVWLLVRAGPEHRVPLGWSWGGIALGLAALTRSEIIGVVPLLLLWALLGFPRKAAALYGWLLCAVFAAFTMMPWLMRNSLVLGAPVLTTDGGYTFWCGNHPRSSGGGECFLPEDSARFGRLTEVEMDREFYRAGWQLVEREPKRFAALALRRLWHLWRPVPHAEHVGTGAAIVGGLEFIPLLALGAWGAILLRHRRPVLLLFGLLFAYVSLVHMAFMSVTRYRVPLLPLLMVLAGAALARLAGESAPGEAG